MDAQSTLMDLKYTKDRCIISFDVLCFSPQVLVFVDDLNMPTLDSYGAQPSMELIRQFIELQGVFDAKTLTWKVQYNNHGVIRVRVYHFPVMCDANHSYVKQNPLEFLGGLFSSSFDIRCDE